MRRTLVLLAVLLTTATPLSLHAQSALTTTTTLTVTPSVSSPFEQIVTLTATVTDSSNNVVLNGTVTFRDGAVTLGTAYLISNSSAGFTPGTAILRTRSLAQGSHSLTASFIGTATDQSSTSGEQVLMIAAPFGPYPSATVLTSTGDANGQYGLFAIVGGLGPFAPTGMIDFNDTTTGSSLGTQPLTTGSWGLLLNSESLPSTISTCGGVTAEAAGDFNNDGDLDLVIAGPTFCGLGDSFVTTLLGDGNGTFAPSTSVVDLGIPGDPQQIVVADFNGDGNLDIAVLDDGGVYLLLGNGNGTFQPPVTLSTQAPASALAVGNFTGTELPDLAVAAFDGNTPPQDVFISVLPGQSGGTLGAPITTTVDISEIPSNDVWAASPTLAMAAGDVNNDGITDLVVATGGVVNVLLCSGSGTFSSQMFQDGDYAPVELTGVSVALADLSGSGNQDIIVGSQGSGTASGDSNSQVSVLPGNGTGVFPDSEVVTYPLPNLTTPSGAENADPSTLVVGDFSYTGNIGILVIGDNGYFLLAGNALGSLQAAAPVSIPGPAGQSTLTSEVPTVGGDFTNDGNIDLAAPVPNSDYSEQLLGMFRPALLGTSSLSSVSVAGSGVQQVYTAYSGDGNFAPSTSNPVLLDTRIPTTDVVSLPPLPGGYSPTQVIAGYTATIVSTIGTANGELPPTGTVQFYDNGVALGSPVTLSESSASTYTSWSSPGWHFLSAVYSGDGNYQPETAATVPIQVETSGSPGLAESGQPAQTATSVPFSVNVTVPQEAVGPIPTGTVSIYLSPGGALLGEGTLGGSPPSTSITLNSSVQPIPVGDYNLYYYYSGNGPWESAWNYYPITIQGTTTLSISYSGASTVSAGSPVTIIGQLSTNQPGPALDGVVSVLDNGNVIATTAVSASSPLILRFTVNTAASPFPAGPNVLSLSYSGGTYWTASTSGTVSITGNATASTSLTSNLPSSLEAFFGASVQFTATVTPLGSSSAPTGTVQFYDGSTVIGAPVSLLNGTASYTSTTFAAGSHSIAAHYSGDSNYPPEVSPMIALDVVTSGTSEVAFSTPPAAQEFAGVTFNVAVQVQGSPAILGPAPSGTVSLIENGTTFATGTLGASGSVTIPLSSITNGLPLGANALSVSYSGNSLWSSSVSAAADFTISHAQVTVQNFGCQPNTPQYPGTPITCSGTLQNGSGGTPPLPTGNVSLVDVANDNAVLASQPISANPTDNYFPLSISVQTNTVADPLSSGNHEFEFVYAGDATWDGFSTPPAEQTIKAAVPTFTLTSSLSGYGSVVQGTPVTFTATASGSVGVPTGTVQFSIDGTAAGSPVAIGGGMATCQTSSLGPGQHTVTAAYSGNSYYGATTTNDVITVVTQGGDSTTITLLGPTSVALGTPVTVNGTVTPAALGPAPSGTVTLMDGSTVLATVPLSGMWPAQVSFSVNTASSPLAASAHTFSLEYGGTTQWAASSSASTGITITKATTATTVTTSASTITAGTSVTFTATVASAITSPIPSGTVQFYDGATALGSPVTLSANSASYTTAALAGGSHSITAAYSGDSNFAASTSAALSETVESLSIQSSATSQSVSPGGSATYALTVTGNNEDESTTFGCSGLPTGAACSFSPSTVAGSGTTTMTITTTGSQAMANPSALKLWSSRGGALFACVLLLMVPGRRRKFWLCLVLLFAFLPTFTVGCGGGGGSTGGGGNSVTPAGTYTITVAATAGSGASSLTQTTTVTLVVK